MHFGFIRSFFYGSCFYLSPAAEGLLLGCTLLSLCSLDKTAENLLAAGNPYRPWQKQVRAHRGKRPLTPTTYRSQAAGETASMPEKGSCAPRPLGTDGSDMEANALHRSTRDAARLPSGALSPCLETQVKGLFPPAEGRRPNHRLDQANGEGQSPSSVLKGFVENC